MDFKEDAPKANGKEAEEMRGLLRLNSIIFNLIHESHKADYFWINHKVSSFI